MNLYLYAVGPVGDLMVVDAVGSDEILRQIDWPQILECVDDEIGKVARVSCGKTRGRISTPRGFVTSRHVEE